MAKLIEVSPTRKNIPDRVERAIVKFARIARSNAINGGASALTKLDRLERMGSPHTSEYHDAITAAYHSSTGSARQYLAYECPECGCTCIGEDAAYAHCAESDVWDDEDTDNESDDE